MDNQIELAIDAQYRAPREKPSDIEAEIASEHYFPERCMTLCVLVLRDGFIVTGESMRTSPDTVTGCEAARKNAEAKIRARNQRDQKEKAK